MEFERENGLERAGKGKCIEISRQYLFMDVVGGEHPYQSHLARVVDHDITSSLSMLFQTMYTLHGISESTHF